MIKGVQHAFIKQYFAISILVVNCILSVILYLPVHKEPAAIKYAPSYRQI